MSGYSQVKTSQVESTVDTELTIKPHFVLLFEAYDDYQTVALSATITIFTERVALFHETEPNRTKPDETERLLSSNVLQKCIK